MKTVLGLSVTSHGIAWALVGGDGRTTDLTSLDDDAFDVDATGDVTTRAAAAARSAQAIGAASGQNVAAIGVCATGLVSDDGHDAVAQLLDLLADAGFDDVRIVPGRSDTTARAAALAVATDAVARTPRPAAFRAPAPRRHTAVRAVAASAVAIAAGLLTVGSQFVEPVPDPAADDADITAAAEPQLVTVITPRDVTRTVAESPAQPAASIQAAERAERVPVAEPVAVVQVPALALAPTPSQTPTVPIQQPVAVTVPHLPAAEPHLPVPAAQPHIAADPSPGPALPVAVPAAQPSPAPAAGLWFLGAMP
ncbi:hypothetical protein [Mycobacterium sp. NPDC050441]|uniref:hypothetical protein n=1 Tax=Mycobacterium sp. NPDC050441 TaxID=3155403 RepID=UPI0033FB3B95